MIETIQIISRIMVVIAATLSGLLAISAIRNAILTQAEKKKYSAPGMLVTVHGDKMHVYSKGSGEKKIVLLGGLGTPGPAQDFKHLMDGLSAQYTVIVVEYFGRGWSEKTDAPRTIANLVEETRAALKLAGFAPPYILMPHSISGIYTLYYVHTYPEEIEAIIGLDTPFPAMYAIMAKNKMRNTYPLSLLGSGFLEFIRASGLGRVAMQLAPEKLGVTKIDSFSAADMSLSKTMTLWNGGNPNMIDESNRLLDHYRAVQNMEIPPHIPTAFILADSNVEASARRLKLDWKKQHEDQVAGNVYGKVIVLAGSHSIHHNHVEDIKTMVDDLLKNEKK